MRRLPQSCTWLACGLQCRLYSEARTNFDGSKQAAGSTQPDARSEFPLKNPVFRKTHIEWKMHHGHGDRYGKYGPSREIADWEFEDGTPSSISPRRFALKHHQDHLLVQLIRAGAAVEKFEREGLLPKIPGTKEQRDWDPEIPLFLEDLDERGHRPVATDVTGRVVDERFEAQTAKPSSNVANTHAGEALEPNTMFATYDPAAFVSDEPRVTDRRRPYWSRRRWALTDNFMVPVSPKPKNTIKDE